MDRAGLLSLAHDWEVDAKESDLVVHKLNLKVKDWLDEYNFRFDAEIKDVGGVPWTIYMCSQSSQVSTSSPLIKPLLNVFNLTFKKLNESADRYSALPSVSTKDPPPRLVILGVYVSLFIHCLIYFSSNSL